MSFAQPQHREGKHRSGISWQRGVLAQGCAPWLLALAPPALAPPKIHLERAVRCACCHLQPGDTRWGATRLLLHPGEELSSWLQCPSVNSHVTFAVICTRTMLRVPTGTKWARPLCHRGSALSCSSPFRGHRNTAWDGRNPPPAPSAPAWRLLRNKKRLQLEAAVLQTRGEALELSLCSLN